MRWSVLVAILIAGFSTIASAQRYEVHPYAGGFFPGKFLDLIEVRNEGIYGIKAGMFLKGGLQAEGNIGYINNLRFENTFTRRKAYIWEGMVSYNLGGAPNLYGTFGLGAVTTTVSDDSSMLWNPSVLSTDRFLSLSYGGGMKVSRVWGPVGYRADIRGRTLPHFYGFRYNWLELTGGLTFAWGER